MPEVRTPAADRCSEIAQLSRLSVVITNYNYRRFVSAAIESALNLRWHDVEVVVVDDGSTDDSPAVIDTYADRITFLRTENATQRVAANRGFALTTGDAVVFLDSDDVLPPDLPARLAEVWTARISKVQFQMQRIDERGAPIGVPFPSYSPVPTPTQIRRWASATSAYPSPPGSGNVYSRVFLDRIFPVGPSVGDAADSACLAAAPFLGDVVTVQGVLVGYRQHSGNDSDLLKDHSRFAREVTRARARWRFSQVACGVSEVDERPLFRSRELLQLRIAAQRLVPAEDSLPGDSRRRMTRDAIRSPFHIGPESLRRKLMIAGWCLATLVAPTRVAHWLLNVRYRRR